MLFKTYQKLLGASCLVLYLVGCGSGESPVEIVDYGSQLQISSKVDSVTIQGVKLNRGNCVVNFIPSEEAIQIGALSQMDALGQIAILSQLSQFNQITPISMQDFKDMASVYKGLDNKEKLADMQNKISQLEQKGVMMESQTLKFGESLKGTSQGCDIIEAEIQTNKGAWTFTFNE